jgi:hypothetical protein
MMSPDPDSTRSEQWALDQLAKSAFFHRKLHEWRLVEMAEQIYRVRGESLDWNDLDISEDAWNKVIHRGIKPVVVFAHPEVLQSVASSAAYYRMLAMASQSSMTRIGLNLAPFETGQVMTDVTFARTVACHLNYIVSALIEADETLDGREFDLWRGMTAGIQAQGSWLNRT